MANMATIIGKSPLSDPSKNKVCGLLAHCDDDVASSTHRPLIYKTKKTSDPDVPTCTDEMSGDDGPEFRLAMTKETQNLTKRKTWSSVDCKSIPSHKKIVPGTWAFKVKHKPDGSCLKHKARFCVRGNLQKKQVDDNADSHAPAVAWSTVRLMLLMSLCFNLVTEHLDFSNAFAQTDLPEGEEVHVELPQ